MARRTGWTPRWQALGVAAMLAWGVAAAQTGASLAALDAVPPALQDWVPWVLHDVQEAGCVHAPGEARADAPRPCSWPTRLAVDAREDGAHFVLEWQADAEGWVELPGGPSQWPERVVTAEGNALVLERDGRPALWATAGNHWARGQWRWHRLPEQLRIPDSVALVELTVNGAVLATPTQRANGGVSLRPVEAASANDTLELQVFRRVVDALPLQIVTLIEIEAAGRPREVVLDAGLTPEQFPLLRIAAPMPARLESDGRLRLQLTPGTSAVEIVQRATLPLDALTRPTPRGLWASQEVWAFEARPQRRQVRPEGPPTLHPDQTRLPAAWRNYPVFLMEPGAVLHLRAVQPGGHAQADRLTLQRALWLDFDGHGYTVRDTFEGMLYGDRRLQGLEGLALGRALRDGRPQFVTRLADDEAPGVTLGAGPVQAEVSGRLTAADDGSLPVSGWSLPAERTHAVLHLPPGWRLLGAGGAEGVNDSWSARWTLLDLFLVLLTTLAFQRLWGYAAATVALAGLALTYHEPFSPAPYWLFALAPIALLRVVPGGFLERLVRAVRNVALLGLVLASLGFSALQLRAAVHPQLALPQFSLVRSDAGLRPQAPQPKALAAESMVRLQDSAPEALPDYLPGIEPPSGPAIPAWQWQRIALSWSAPVTADARWQPYLLPPRWTRGLQALGVLLTLMLLLRCLPPPRQSSGHGVSVMAALAVLTLAAASAESARAAGLPDQELLDELRARLLAPPPCHPDCAALSALTVEADGDGFALDLELHAERPSAVPLPWPELLGSPQVRTTSLTEQVALRRDPAGQLWMRLSAGVTRLRLEATLPPGLAAIDLHLPLPPGRLEQRLQGWLTPAFGADAVAVGTLRLEREPQALAQELAPSVPAPYVRVDRYIDLNVDWRVTTEVMRLSDASEPQRIAVSLLPGERPVGADLEVSDGALHLVFAAGQEVASWTSTLPKATRLELTAPPLEQYAETWSLSSSSLWYPVASGLDATLEGNVRVWQPGPGDTLRIDIAAPLGVEAETVTLDGARLLVEPGREGLRGHVELALRSSVGREHVLALPEGYRATALRLDDRALPMADGGPQQRLQLPPGEHRVTLEWVAPRTQGVRLVSPAIDAGAAGGNIDIDLRVPSDRWVLAVGGPLLGPAMLFWGVLLLVAVIALVLARASHTPLRLHQWLLLGVGLVAASAAAAVIVVAWLLITARRGATDPLAMRAASFNAGQVLIALLTVAALVALFGSISQGLLGSPDMQISGNGSSAEVLRWYQDRSPSGVFPEAWVIAVPMGVYRGLMLAWALWLAQALLGWLRWWWGCYSHGALWRRLQLRRATQRPAAASAQGPITSTPPM